MKLYYNGSISKSRKTLRKGNYYNVDEKVKDWVEFMRSKNIELSQEAIINKANEYMLELNPESNLSSGWFYGFIKRYNLKRNSFHR